MDNSRCEDTPCFRKFVFPTQHFIKECLDVPQESIRKAAERTQLVYDRVCS